MLGLHFLIQNIHKGAIINEFFTIILYLMLRNSTIGKPGKIVHNIKKIDMLCNARSLYMDNTPNIRPHDSRFDIGYRKF